MRSHFLRNMVLPVAISFSLAGHAADSIAGDSISEAKPIIKRSYKLVADEDSASNSWIHTKAKVFKVTHEQSNQKGLPTAADVRDNVQNFPPAYDQGELGSCTANALDGLVTYDWLFQGNQLQDFSREFLYYNQRALEGSVNEDAGASLADGIRALHHWGIAEETLWPYEVTNFTAKPSTAAYANALNYVDLDANYLAVDHIQQTLASFKHVISVLKRPFVLGIQVYESFESAEVARTGIVPMPAATERCLGGHAVLAVGYDDAKGTFTIRNSWGPDWGDHGYFYLPYAYVLNRDLAQDFWSVSKIGKAPGRNELTIAGQRASIDETVVSIWEKSADL